MDVKRAIKTLYKAFPFKQSAFKLMQKVWNPPASIYRHLYFEGTFEVQVSKSESFKIKHYGFEIENELFWRGIKDGWEKVSINLWIQLCRKSKFILDIGANTGIYALLAKTVNPTASIFAFGPVQRVFDKLLINCNINNYDISCLNKAASNYNGKAIIYDTNENHIYSVTVNKNLHNSNVAVSQFEIDTITLEQFVRDNKLPRIDLMKIDVETHEPEVLQGFGEYLALFKPTLLIEVLNDEVGQKINNLVNGLGYLYFNIDENRGITLVDKIEHSSYFNYLICSRQIALELDLIN